MRMRLLHVLLTGALLALTGAAAAQTTAPIPTALTPQQRAAAEAAAVRARATAALQARAEAEAAAKTAGFAPMANAQLVYGAYACTLNSFDAAARRMSFTSKGTIQFNANGTYHYPEGSGLAGRYTYDPTTRQVIWLTGYFAEHGQTKTTFTTTDKTSQLDIEFSSPNGSTQKWSCGCSGK